MFKVSRYTIGWICAIQTELVAAKVFLDDIHDDTEYEAAPNDNNSYVFGRIGGHNVVIAALPSGEYGTNSAASVARDLIRSFTSIRIALMVGIAGGAPLAGVDGKFIRDIRLGDVVVSKPTDGTGGVWQYDFGKVVQDHDFRRTGHLNQPPTSLLTAVTSLGADIEMRGHDLEHAVADALAKWPRLRKKYSRPDATTDRLYKSSFRHQDDKSACAVICNEDQEMVTRKDRDDAEGEESIAIHHGIIASGNSLMRDAFARDALARDSAVLCFEMEAAGLMNQFPCLVIRGICDYSDTHKNKEWQGYAAMTAAAYARELLLRVAPGKVQSEVKLSELLVDMEHRLQHRLQNST